jgi:MoxR-like ATPase
MSDERPTRPRNRRRGSRRNPTGSDVVDWKLAEKVLASPSVRSTYIWGPPGTGKTWAALNVGTGDGETFAVACTEDMAGSELRGNYLPMGSGAVWQDGPATRAMRLGQRLVLSEPSRASDDALSFLYCVIESPETARMTLPSRETITPAPGFNCVLCDNCPPDELPEALQDRFETTLEIRAPHPDALALLSPELREAALRSFDLEEGRRVSLRSWLKLEQLRIEFGLRDACLAIFGGPRGSQILDALAMAGVV